MIPINKIYFGDVLVWEKSYTDDMMPHLNGMLCYYDCDDGIQTEGGNPAWVNRISGGSSMTLHNASIAQDGAISFYGGNDPGNGKFSCNTTENATMYVLFKRTGDGNADNYIHICGSVANGQHFPYAGGGSAIWIHGVQFMLNSNVYTDAYTGLFQYDITDNVIRDMSLSCLDYHVVCCIRKKNGAVYDNLMYVDGIYIGRIDGSSYPPGTNYGVCIGVDSFGYEDKTHDGYDTLYKMIAVSNQAHTAQQVVENSRWLLDHFNINIYTPLEYIQSTNRQTINTGYIPNENSRIEAEFMLYTSYFNEYIQALFGNKSWELIYNRSQTLRTEYRFGSGSVSSTTAVLPYHKRFRLVCDKDGAAWYDNDGVQLGSVSVTGTSPSESSLFIGSTTNVDYGCYRIYSFKVYEGDTLVMNLTPVQRNGDGVCGLLDTVSGKFFMDVGSQGAGYYSDRFEDSYQQLDAVETSGNLYVDTDYIPNASTRIIIDSIPKTAGSSDGEILLGCTNNVQSSTDDLVINTEYRSSPYLPYYQRGGAYVYFDSVNSMERRSTIEIYQNDVTIEYEDGTSEQYTVSGTPSSYTSPVSLYLFALHYEAGSYTSTSHARFYNCKIEEIESDIVKQIHNFIPVKRKFDDIIVLYDTISNSEYPPVGGTFTGWSSNIFDTLTFSGGWLGTDGNVNHQRPENYGTSDYFLCGDSTKVRVSFTPQYTDERGVMVCAYDKDHTFIGSPIYASMKPPYTLDEKEFIGEIPSGAVYLRYSYLWGKYNSAVPNDLNTVVQLGK